MHVHLVDGTYELFRAYYGAPGRSAPDGREVGATRQLMRSLLGLFEHFLKLLVVSFLPKYRHFSACAVDYMICVSR